MPFRTVNRRRLGTIASGVVAAGTINAVGTAGSPAAAALSKRGQIDAVLARHIRRRGSATRHALGDLVNGLLVRFAERELPRLLGEQARDRASPLRVALAEVFITDVPGVDQDPDTGAGLLPPTLAVMSWDKFRRSNRRLEGDRAPSGHVYRTTGPPETNLLEDGRYVPRPLPGHASILYTELERTPDTVAAEFVWRSGSTQGANVVLGTCKEGFGLGSVQLAIYGSTEDKRAHRWVLFAVPNPIVDPYPVLAAGDLREDFEFRMDGITRYRFYLHRTGSDGVLLQLPDGQIITHRHAAIASYWGKVSGVQLRRPRSGDAYAEFTAVASSGPR